MEPLLSALAQSSQPGDRSRTSTFRICSIWPSARMSRWGDPASARPFLNQVMLGAGTALDSHSSDTELPSRTFRTERDSPFWSLMLGGTVREEQEYREGVCMQPLGMTTTATDKERTFKGMKTNHKLSGRFSSCFPRPG